jgi:hypothetical protein
LSGWLTTVTARASLDMLRSRESRREENLDPGAIHMPDPIVSNAAGMDPEHEALLADSIGLALLVVLENLAPAERLAFVLHDMFGVPFEGSHLDLPLVVAGNHDGVVELDDMLERQLPECAAYGFSRIAIGIDNGNQIAHGRVLCI